MRRRALCVGGMAFAGAIAPMSVFAAAKTYRLGYLSYGTREQSAELVREFTEGLRRLGYVDGRDVFIEQHYGDGTLNFLPDLAAGVVRSRVDVIVTGSNPIAAAAKRATATIPIVMVGTRDPVGVGLVTNLARPDGNVTGLCVDASDEMAGKTLGLLTEIVPGLSRVGVLRQIGEQQHGLETAAQRLNVELFIVEVGTTDELENNFAAMVRRRVGAVLVVGPLFFVQRQRVAELALKHRLPAIHALKEYARAGLLITYGANLADLYRRAAGYVDRIIKGAKPGDLPVEQPTKFDLVINLKTAKALGLSIPKSMLLRADELIE